MHVCIFARNLQQSLSTPQQLLHYFNGLTENAGHEIAGHEIARHDKYRACHGMKTMKDRAIVATVESGYSGAMVNLLSLFWRIIRMPTLD